MMIPGAHSTEEGRAGVLNYGKHLLRAHETEWTELSAELGL